MADTGLFWLLAVLVVALAVGGAIWQRRIAQQRQLAFASFASNMGLEYAAVDPFGLLGWPFSLFAKGDGRGIENVVWGTSNGLALHVFDYWYYDVTTDSEGRRSKRYYRFDCAVGSVDAMCAHLTIDRENLFTRLADALSLRDIQFESEEFNRDFNVKCGDRAFANAFVDARMMAWLLGEGRGFAYEAVGDLVLVAGPKVAPEALPAIVATLRAFVAHVPRVVSELYPRR